MFQSFDSGGVNKSVCRGRLITVAKSSLAAPVFKMMSMVTLDFFGSAASNIVTKWASQSIRAPVSFDSCIDSISVVAYCHSFDSLSVSSSSDLVSMHSSSFFVSTGDYSEAD